MTIMKELYSLLKSKDKDNNEGTLIIIKSKDKENHERTLIIIFN